MHFFLLYLILGVFASVGMLPLILLDKEVAKESNIEAYQDKELAAKLRNQSYTSIKYQTALKFLLKRFDNLGVLDEEY